MLAVRGSVTIRFDVSRRRRHAYSIAVYRLTSANTAALVGRILFRRAGLCTALLGVRESMRALRLLQRPEAAADRVFERSV
jgi:hypothetical protein